MGIETYNKTINQYTLEGNFVNSYLSFSQAKKQTGLPLPQIIPKYKFSCGYFWIYENENISIEEVLLNYKNNHNLTKKI